jgi:hypothetical protein
MVMALDEAADVDVALVEQLPPPPAEGDEEDDEAEDEEGRIVVAVGMVINPCLNAEQFLSQSQRESST